jgi:serine phosphatase RsbU (regulator of sigma subunit)
MLTAPPVADDEKERLAELAKLELMYSKPEEVFDRITAQLSEIFEMPAVMINILDRDSQYVKSAAGIPDAVLGSRVMPRKMSICAHVVGNNEQLIVEDLAADVRFRDNPALTEKGVRFYAGTPLRTENGQPIGSLCVVDFKPRQITPREQKMLRLVADEVMTEVKLRSISRQLVARTRAMQHDLSAARAVQRFLLPPQRQAGSGFALWHHYHPVEAIGGDFIDGRLREDGSIAALVADVSGHGPSAALTSAMVKTVFQHVAPAAAGPAALLTSIQRELSVFLGTNQFVTAAAVVFDPETRSAHLASAGHPFPMLLRDGKVEIVPTVNDLPLMIEPEESYGRQTALKLETGDRLIWYTDGASEAADPDGEMLDAQGLIRMIQGNAHLPGGSFLPALFGDIRAYAHGQLHDDVALVCLDVT